MWLDRKGPEAIQIANAGTARYYAELRRMPASGGGGCHPALLRVANYGRLAGIAPDQVVRDLAAHVHGTRRVSTTEIAAAVEKSFGFSSMDAPNGSPWVATLSPRVDGAKLLDSILKRGANFNESELSKASPVCIDWRPHSAPSQILRRLYRPEDYLFIGARHDGGAKHVLPVSKWLANFERDIEIGEFIIPNPLTGKAGSTKDGKPSFRADGCVAEFRFAVIEFDNLPRDKQIRFWAGAPLPVVALIDSGGKSIHAWVRIDATNADEWTQRVEGKLFTLLADVGVDATCKNESRLSRMPGHFREEKKRWQRVLYLNPTGAPILR